MKWRVDFVSGSYVNWANVEARTILQAIEKAMIEFEEDDGRWPYDAMSATISVMVIK